MIARARSLSVLLILLGGALAIISSTQTWLDVTIAAGADPLPVPGGSALPVLAPLSLAALALALVLSIVGVALRYIAGALALALGAAIVWMTWRIATEQPVSAVASVVTTATGISGTGVSGLVRHITASPWPVITIGAGVLIIIGGLFTLATAHRWSRAGRRYEQAADASSAPARPRDAIDSWDDLSKGSDPTL